MKILITGGTGFVGRNLVPDLLESGHSVAVVARNHVAVEEAYGDRVELIHKGEDLSVLKEGIRRFNPQVVVHLAAFSTAADDEEALERLLESNIDFGCHLLDALQGCDVELFIHAGSFSEYLAGDGDLNPAYLYSATKTAFRSFLEYYSGKAGFKAVTLVLYTVYGPGDRNKKVIDYIIEAASADEPIDMTDGRQVLDFIHVNDVARLVETVIEKADRLEERHSVFHVGTSNGVSVRDAAAIVETKLGKKPRINWGGRQYRPRDVMHAVADTRALEKTFNWKAQIQAEEGFASLLNR